MVSCVQTLPLAQQGPFVSRVCQGGLCLPSAGRCTERPQLPLLDWDPLPGSRVSEGRGDPSEDCGDPSEAGFLWSDSGNQDAFM